MITNSQKDYLSLSPDQCLNSGVSSQDADSEGAAIPMPADCGQEAPLTAIWVAPELCSWVSVPVRP